jgi:hypothetical protein
MQRLVLRNSGLPELPLSWKQIRGSQPPNRPHMKLQQIIKVLACVSERIIPNPFSSVFRKHKSPELSLYGTEWARRDDSAQEDNNCCGDPAAVEHRFFKTFNIINNINTGASNNAVTCRASRHQLVTAGKRVPIITFSIY